MPFAGGSSLPRPDDIDAVVDFAVDALDRLDEDAGLRAVEASLKTCPQEPRLWQVAGLLWRSKDELSHAAAAFDRASSLAPRDARIAHGRARCYLEAGRRAAALFSRAQALAPQDQSVTLGWAAAEVADRKTGAAIDLIERRLTADPLWVDGQAYLAKLRWLAGDSQDYARSLRSALDRFPENIELWRHYLAILMQGSHFEDILSVVQSRDALAPLFKSYRAAALDELGETDRAAEAFAQIDLTSDPGNAVYFVRHLLRVSRYRDAAALAESWAATPAADTFLPYLATAWRLLDDPRWAALEGNDSLVGVYDLGARLDLVQLSETLHHLHNYATHPIDQSVRTGTQTDGYLFAREEPIIRALRAACAEAVAGHLRNLGSANANASDVRFSGAWSVKLAGGGHHTNHVHPGGMLSSAFYVALPPTTGQSQAQAGWLQLVQPPLELGLGLEPFRYVEPVPGKLVLFPSTMWHGTVPFDSGERLTVAFDVAKPSGRGTSP